MATTARTTTPRRTPAATKTSRTHHDAQATTPASSTAATHVQPGPAPETPTTPDDACATSPATAKTSGAAQVVLPYAGNGPLTLTQIVMNTRHRDVNRDLADAHGMHRRIMSLLPDDIGAMARAATSTLHRLEETPSGPRLLIQTRGPVSLDRLPEHYSLRTRTLDMTAFLASLKRGQLIRYAITANVTKRSAQEKTMGMRLALVTHEDLNAWWTRRSVEAGLKLDEGQVSIEPAAAVNGRRVGEDKQAQAIHHRAQRIEGVASIAGAVALRQALEAGIGPGKAYGLGLLSIAPLTR